MDSVIWSCRCCCKVCDVGRPPLPVPGTHLPGTLLDFFQKFDFEPSFIPALLTADMAPAFGKRLLLSASLLQIIVQIQLQLTSFLNTTPEHIKSIYCDFCIMGYLKRRFVLWLPSRYPNIVRSSQTGYDDTRHSTLAYLPCAIVVLHDPAVFFKARILQE